MYLRLGPPMVERLVAMVYTAGQVSERRFHGTDDDVNVTEPLVADPDLTDLPRRITCGSFTEAAYSAGESRLFGGIHFHQGNMAGLQAGRQVGLAAWAKAQSYF
jgi:hypothetical protein